MARINGLSVEVDVQLNIPDELAATCATLLNMWLKNNITRAVTIEQNEQTHVVQIGIDGLAIARECPSV